MPVGTTVSQLRIFVDRNSVVRRGPLREATVRMGAPGVITGRIAIVYQVEQFDCSARTWRLISYRAVDGDRKLVISKPAAATPGLLMPVQPNTPGERTLDAVCALDVAAP